MWGYFESGSATLSKSKKAAPFIRCSSKNCFLPLWGELGIYHVASKGTTLAPSTELESNALNAEGVTVDKSCFDILVNTKLRFRI